MTTTRTAITKTAATAALAAENLTWASPYVDIVDALWEPVNKATRATDDSDGISDVEHAVAAILSKWAA